MLKLASVSVLAAAAVVAAASAPLSAASLTTNMSPHISVGRPMNNFNNSNIGASNQFFTPNTNGPKLKPKVPKPQTDRGGCHTKSNSIQRCYY